jgi:hypothetical protein
MSSTERIRRLTLRVPARPEHAGRR